MRALLGTVTHFCEAAVLKLRTVPIVRDDALASAIKRKVACCVCGKKIVKPGTEKRAQTGQNGLRESWWSGEENVEEMRV